MKPPLSLFESLSEWATMAPGLERVERVLKALGQPHKAYPHILVGGTNGKGTVCVNIAAGLSGSVGVFLSPHVYDIRERILINGEPCGDHWWGWAYERIQENASVEASALSYFEWTLILAVIIFRETVDIAVFEVGLGGRQDATNALDPDLSVITNVSLEHQLLLGNTLEAIAREKLCIGRPNKPFLIPKAVADLKGVSDFLTERELTPQVYENKGLCDDNFALSQRVVDLLEANAGNWLPVALPGRREFVNVASGIYLDGAHNPAAWENLLHWCQTEIGQTFNVVCSVTTGRKPQDLIDLFSSVNGSIWRFEAGYERECAKDLWPAEIKDVRTLAINRVIERPLLVCGSLYMLKPFKDWMSRWNL